MSATLSCPERSVLKDLVDGSLSSTDADRLTAHLDTCFVCQETVEIIAAGDRALPDLAGKEHRGEPEPGTALYRVIEDLESRSSIPGVVTDADAASAMPASFLDAPHDPTHIGRLGRFGSGV